MGGWFGVALQDTAIASASCNYKQTLSLPSLQLQTNPFFVVPRRHANTLSLPHPHYLFPVFPVPLRTASTPTSCGTFHTRVHVVEGELHVHMPTLSPPPSCLGFAWELAVQYKQISAALAGRLRPVYSIS